MRIHGLLHETKKKIRSENHPGSGQQNSSFFYVFHYMTFENVKFDKNFTNFHRTLFKMVIDCAYAWPITGNEEKKSDPKTIQGLVSRIHHFSMYFIIWHLKTPNSTKISLISTAHYSKWYLIVHMHRLLQETKKTIRSENHSGSGQQNTSFF